METDLTNIIYGVGIEAGLIKFAVKTTDGAPSDSIAGFAYNAVIDETFNGRKYINTGSTTSSIWTRVDTPDVVTQITSITTTVVLNKKSGVITTVASTLAHDAVAEFQVTNSFAKTDSLILLQVLYASGKTGIPTAWVSTRANGSFKITLANAAGTDALNDVVGIAYTIK